MKNIHKELRPAIQEIGDDLPCHLGYLTEKIHMYIFQKL